MEQPEKFQTFIDVFWAWNVSDELESKKKLSKSWTRRSSYICLIFILSSNNDVFEVCMPATPRPFRFLKPIFHRRDWATMQTPFL